MTKPGTANPRAGMPLSNVRVLDIATMGAGPLAATFLADFGALIASNVQVKACALFPEAACEEIYDPWATVVHDTVCGDVGGVGCWAGGVRCCRRCDAEGLNTCADRDVAWEET